MTAKRTSIVLASLLTLTAAAPSQVRRAASPVLDAYLPATSARMTPLQLRQHQAAQSVQATFRGHATSCAGGGKAVLYLRGTTPSHSGCNVRFEARCPGTAPGRGTHFGKANYNGAGCRPDDNIRIGPMRCAPAQVHIQMTEAHCG